MDGLRQVAKAYYARASEQDQIWARQMFQSFDKNGNGRIHWYELKEWNNSWDPNGNYFKQIDVNGDGYIDFEEFLTYFYIFQAGVVWCDNCWELQSGNFFSCIMCLGNNSYELCCKCYAAGNFQHQHSPENFKDSHARHKLLCEIMENAKLASNNTIEYQGGTQAIRKSPNGYQVAKVLFQVGNVAAATGCSIM